jgi:membrane protein
VAEKVTAPTDAAITAAVDKIFTEQSTGLIAFAAAFAVWEVSRAIRIVGLALNEITDQEENRPLWRRVLVSQALAVVVIISIGLAVVAVVAVGRILDETGGPWRWLLGVLRWPAGAVFLGFAVGVVANYAPVRSHGSRWATAGAAVTVVAWLIESALFAFYVARIGNYRSAAGNLLLFLVATGYLYVSAIVFLVGMQLDEFLQEDSPGEEPHPLVLLRRLVHRA